MRAVGNGLGWRGTVRQAWRGSTRKGSDRKGEVNKWRLKRKHVGDSPNNPAVVANACVVGDH